MRELVLQDQAQSVAAAALAAAKAAASGTGHGQVSVMETRRFAGKDIQVSVHYACSPANVLASNTANMEVSSISQDMPLRAVSAS